MKALRLLSVNSDRTAVPEPTRTVTLVHPNTGKELEGVAVVVRILSDEAHKAIEKEHREPQKDGRGAVTGWTIHRERVVDDVLRRSMMSWTGIVGADNRPVPLCGATIAALDDLNKSHIYSLCLTRTDLIDAAVVEESFREPDGVGAVAG